MPAYNGEKYIVQAIRSVLDQSYENWELLIIDDGSTDGTADVVATFRDQRIRYVFQENRGQAASLNRGLDLAVGDYVTTLDVDDWFTPNSIGDRVAFLGRYTQYDVVYGDGVYCDMGGNQLMRFSDSRTNEISGDVFDFMLSDSFFGTGSNVMIRRSLLENDHLRYDESIVWCQDYDLYLRLAERYKFGYVNSTMVWYRLHQDNMTRTMASGRRRESLVRTKLRALASERFERTLLSQKINFFYILLTHDLNGDLAGQMKLTDHLQFQKLPRHEQARLIRLCASIYLSDCLHIDAVKVMLGKSWALNPYDPKTLLALLLAYFNKGPLKWLFNFWRGMRMQNPSFRSPFDQVK